MGPRVLHSGIHKHVATTNLKELFNHVVDDEQREDALARHHKVVAGRHVADQLHRAEVP